MFYFAEAILFTLKIFTSVNLLQYSLVMSFLTIFHSHSRHTQSTDIFILKEDSDSEAQIQACLSL